MPVLILGSKGMLGQELMGVFSDHNPCGWDKDKIDICDFAQTRKKIAQVRPELIINAAAYTDVDGAEENKKLAMKVNGKAVGNLAKIASDLGAILVHYSTDYVFSGGKEAGYQEDEPVSLLGNDNSPESLPSNDKKLLGNGGPINIYGASKALGEKLLQENTEKFYLIRTSWLFGPGGGNFAQTMLNLAEDKNELKVVSDQHGRPTYAPDLAQATRDLLESKKEFGIYHRTNEVEGDYITWHDFACEIFEQYSKINSDFEKPEVRPVTSEEFPTPAQRPSWSVLLNTKLPPLRNYKEALKEYLQEYF